MTDMTAKTALGKGGMCSSASLLVAITDLQQKDKDVIIGFRITMSSCLVCTHLSRHYCEHFIWHIDFVFMEVVSSRLSERRRI